MTRETISFVYVTYIVSTPEKVFEAITKPDVARRYWGHENVSDWKSGSKWKHIAADPTGHHLGGPFAGLRSGKSQPGDLRDRGIRGHGPADGHP
jgi:uncharacterized protein YndB with AHSA1/START domain